MFIYAWFEKLNVYLLFWYLPYMKRSLQIICSASKNNMPGSEGVNSSHSFHIFWNWLKVSKIPLMTIAPECHEYLFRKVLEDSVIVIGLLSKLAKVWWIWNIEEKVLSSFSRRLIFVWTMQFFLVFFDVPIRLLKDENEKFILFVVVVAFLSFENPADDTTCNKNFNLPKNLIWAFK